MAMNQWILQALQIDSETVSRSVKFFESYGKRVAPSIARPSDVSSFRDWTDGGTAATGLRFAAQFASLIEVEEARRLLNQAALLYVSLGVPYGYFLYASFVDRSDAIRSLSSDPAVQWLRRLSSHTLSDIPREPGRLDYVALSYPVQQVYLFLAMTAHSEIWREFSSELGSLRKSLALHNGQPVGPQGTPARAYLRVGELLQHIHHHDTEARGQAVVELANLARRYEASILEAKENHFLWSQMQSPIDIVDLDVVGLTTMVDSALEQASMERLRLRESIFEQLSDIGRIPIDIGLSIRRRHLHAV